MPSTYRTDNIPTGVLAALIAVAGSAPAIAQNESAVAQACIHPSGIERTKVLDDRNILFYMRNDEVFQNVLPRECTRLKAEDRFGYDVSGDRLCERNMITVVVDTGFELTPGRLCRLGMFLPIAEDEVADLIATLERDDKPRRRQNRAIESKPVELPPQSQPTPATEALSQPTPAAAAPPQTPSAEPAPAPSSEKAAEKH